jgi:hypothetical protein
MTAQEIAISTLPETVQEQRLRYICRPAQELLR